MLKVLLVDDEPLSIEGLKTNVNWQKNGYEICCTAFNGEDAISKIEEYKPDLVVTDIRMPLLDGVGLISHVKNKIDESIRFIIVSGYNEFEYAKKAMEHGVKHYLLKPVFEEELESALIELSTEIQKERKKEILNSEESYTLISNLIKKVTQKDGSIEEFSSLYKNVFEKNNAKQWCYVMFKILPCEYINNDNNEMQNVDKLIESIKTSIKNNRHMFIINHDLNIFGLFIGFVDPKNSQNDIKQVLNNIIQPAIKNRKNKHQIAVGKLITDLKEIRKSYNASLKALEHSFYKDLNSVTFYDSIKNKKFNYSFLYSEFVNLVMEAIEEIDEEKVTSVIQKGFLHFKKNLLDPEIVYMYVKNIIYRSNKVIGDLNGELDYGMDMSYLETRIIPIIQLEKGIISHCNNCCRVLGAINKKAIDENTSRIEEYIKENYKKPITIKEMSKNLYINHVYLGQLFKRIFGMRFNDYIHNLRIEEAKRLLKDTSMETCEIAKALGYSNYNVFLKYFEKNTGEKPNSYRK